MNWINLQVSIIRSPAYVGSNPTERATWFNVLAYCIEHENGGHLTGCRDWKDRQWQQACGVTAREVRQANKLLIESEDGIQVLFYPTEKQNEVQGLREYGKIKSAAKAAAARANGALGGRPKNNPTEKTQENPPKPNGKPIEGEVEVERKEKYNNTLPLVAKPPRARNEQMDALATIAGIPLAEIGEAVAKRLNKVISTIKQSTPDITAQEINKRAANYRTHMDDATLTPEALAKHWSMCHAPSNNSHARNEKRAAFA